MTAFQIAAAQVPALPMGTDLAVFEEQALAILRRAPGANLLAFPEIHLFGPTVDDADARRDELLRGAVDLDGPMVAGLRAIAARLGVWLVPGTLVERGPDDTVLNTAIVLAPDGTVAGAYRKVFPWRPYEPYRPGDAFTVVDIPGHCRLGLSICYDAWFPEVTRHLAWYGADVVLNLVRTTSDDRAQELVLARANAIVNQVFMVSVNCAGPEGRGRSIVTGPEGEVLAESPGAHDDLLVVDLDLDRIEYTRTIGTAGVNRVWSQFRPDDAPIPLPLYAGRIDPATWQPSFQHPGDVAPSESEPLR
ncbi:carbon-nitrogen hydrolase family protein [Nocardioides nematodiphilus]|uniref:carbon-nitrogen hydrolase family protein n=1 Tax=Nocardioides nematodiphilus TaxID=2849669 RepID=UPI001CD925AF|nr:carbon-nitrogen hydrolase family protein [Nocardioides nematodiphilus]MCA1981925.1 carbon-nitrogen hydrolase family protein [Nocardioides nematodiphilus]